MDDRESMSAQSVQQQHHPMQQTQSHMSNAQSNSGPTSVLNNFDFTAIEDLDPSLGKTLPRSHLPVCSTSNSPWTHGHVRP